MPERIASTLGHREEPLWLGRAYIVCFRYRCGFVRPKSVMLVGERSRILLFLHDSRIPRRGGDQVSLTY